MPSKPLNTKQAFYFLMQEDDLPARLGYHRGTIGRIRHDIKYNNKYPSIEKMEEMLVKGGWKVKQEKLWNV